MISTLTPNSVWTIFNQICQIPHPSHHEEAITKFIINFALTNNINYQIDDVGNILLSKAATKGYEHFPSIVLQAHMDMVPQKNEDTAHDFLTDPIIPYIDGDFVKAKGTTLGADNGIGLASALAVLANKKIEHGPLEVLITTSEETGMIGAFGLKPNWSKSHFLINTDSEDEGEIFIGCAGGVDFKSEITLRYQEYNDFLSDADYIAVRLSLKGLKGGHSGCDIHLGRGNAIKLLSRFLCESLTDIDFILSNFKGGTLRNALPRESFAEIIIKKSQLPKLEEKIKFFSDDLCNELKGIEANIQLFSAIINKTKIKNLLTKDCQIHILDWLNSMPNGVIKMAGDIVETSLNLGIVNIEKNQSNNKIVARLLIRSQINSAKNAVISSLASHSRLSNAAFEVKGEYSGWAPNTDSKLLKLATKNYEQVFNTKAKIKVIHAGLECGIFKKNYPDVEMISIGPTIVSPHSPDESVNIKSVEKYWILLLSILKSADQLI